MNKLWLILSLITLSLGNALGQDLSDELPETDEVRSQRVAYITQRLNLTEEEAGHFWTVYSQYEEERQALIARYRREAIRPTSDEAAAQTIEQRLQMETDVLALKRQFYTELQQGVSPRKLVLLPRAEREFKRDLLRQLRRGNN